MEEEKRKKNIKSVRLSDALMAVVEQECSRRRQSFSMFLRSAILNEASTS